MILSDNKCTNNTNVSTWDSSLIQISVYFARKRIVCQKLISTTLHRFEIKNDIDLITIIKIRSILFVHELWFV